MPILLSQLVPSVSSKSAQFLFFSAAALDALPPLAAEKMLGACEAGVEGGICTPASGARGRRYFRTLHAAGPAFEFLKRPLQRFLKPNNSRGRSTKLRAQRSDLLAQGFGSPP